MTMTYTVYIPFIEYKVLLMETYNGAHNDEDHAIVQGTTEGVPDSIQNEEDDVIMQEPPAGMQETDETNGDGPQETQSRRQTRDEKSWK